MSIALNRDSWDVVIAGGGLSGLTLALQLRTELPELSVLVVDRLARPFDEAAHKIGESSVELGSQYLERLGLRDYLHNEHLIKFGLRFFPGGGQLPIEERMEIGPSAEPIVCSYQIDRGRLENDLRDRVTAASAVLLEGVKVADVTLNKGDESHRVTLACGGDKRDIASHWFIDATGRAALLRTRLKLKRGSDHPANAGWFRVEGKIDITDFAGKNAKQWHDNPTAPDRWRSTNHLMGRGYWVWMIPLSSGNTSIGVVVHDRVHGFESVRTLDRAQAFIKEHEPVLAQHLENAKVLDFGCIKGYSHNVGRCFSADRWAITGDAGAFSDPLYSPGTDAIAFANSFIGEIIKTDCDGGDVKRKATELGVQYRALISGTVDLYRDAADVYNHGLAMRTKIYWDNFSYWCFPCQYFLQGIYRETGKSHSRFSTLGMRYVELSKYVQTLMQAWAAYEPEDKPEPGFAPIPAFPSVLVDVHLDLQRDLTPDETFSYMQRRAQEGESLVAEILIRLLLRLGPEQGRKLLNEYNVLSWNLKVSGQRIDHESEIGLARRKVMSPMVRDFDRTFGKPVVNCSTAELKDLLSPLISSDAPFHVEIWSAKERTAKQPGL